MGIFGPDIQRPDWLKSEYEISQEKLKKDKLQKQRIESLKHKYKSKIKDPKEIAKTALAIPGVIKKVHKYGDKIHELTGVKAGIKEQKDLITGKKYYIPTLGYQKGNIDVERVIHPSGKRTQVDVHTDIADVSATVFGPHRELNINKASYTEEDKYKSLKYGPYEVAKKGQWKMVGGKKISLEQDVDWHGDKTYKVSYNMPRDLRDRFGLRDSGLKGTVTKGKDSISAYVGKGEYQGGIDQSPYGLSWWAKKDKVKVKKSPGFFNLEYGGDDRRLYGPLGYDPFKKTPKIGYTKTGKKHKIYGEASKKLPSGFETYGKASYGIDDSQKDFEVGFRWSKGFNKKRR